MNRKPISLEIESDKRLIEYGSFGKYLDSLIDTCDLEYFQDRTVARTIAELGYRSSGIVLDRKSFKKRYKLASDFFYPTFKPLKLASENVAVFPDPLIRALALRERANLEGKFLVKTDSDKGLSFFCKHDHKKIFVDPHRHMGLNTCRINVESPIYEQAILYDHEIMRKVNLDNV